MLVRAHQRAYLKPMTKVLLEDRAVVSVSGPDARPFLQGLVTSDVELVGPGRPVYAALLTPQGKILFDFFLFDGEAGDLLIDCARDVRPALVRRLGLYKLRSKVTVDPSDGHSVSAAWDEQERTASAMAPDPRLPALGLRGITSESGGVKGARLYLERRLDSGIPESADFGSDKIFALDGDLEELNAVSFDKGCYVGQELTARMKHRSTARKRLVPVTVTDGVLPAPGAALDANGTEMGELMSSYGGRGFALVRLDRLAGAEPGTIRIGDAHAIVRRPDWLSA
jgi:folate-binding protein YgfZ